MKTLKTIGQFISINFKEIFNYIGAALGGGALGMLIAYFITLTLSTEEKTGYVTLGTVFGLGLVAILLIFGQSLGGQADFYVTVSMNRARMSYLIGRYLLLVLDVLAAVAACFAINVLEMKVVGPALAKGHEIENLMGNVSPGLIIGLAVVLPLVIIFFTAMYVMFERKFFWAMWAIYMIIALGGPRVSSAMKKSPESIPAKIGEGLNAFFNMGTVPWIIIGVFMLVAFLVADIIIYRKMEVKM